MTGFSVFAIILGVVIVALLRAALRRPPGGGEKSVPGDSVISPATSPPALPPPSAPEPADLGSRLYPLRQAIEGFGESSAHPREIENRDEFKQAVALLADRAVPLEVVVEYALGSNWALSCAGFAAFRERPDQEQALAATLARLPNVGAWPLHFALLFVDSLKERPPVGETLLRMNEQSVNHPLFAQLFLASFKRRETLGDRGSFGASLAREHTLAKGVALLLGKIDHPFARDLKLELEAWKLQRIDRAFLGEFGRFWDEPDSLLILHDAFREPLATAVTAITHVPPRSVLIVGEARVGKSSLARLIGGELQSRGYVIFEASGPELMAGQKYIGELEGRIRRMVAELAAGKKVVWFAPDFLQILLSGSHRGQAAGILDQVLPDVVAGRLVMISKCTPGGFTRALQARPAVRNAFDTVRLRAITPEETSGMVREFAGRVARKFPVEFSEDMDQVALQLARHYLGTMQLPGAVLDLLKLATNRAIANHEARVDRGTLLAALSQLTGLPKVVLDDSERVNLSEMRGFFSARVIGQDEAVGAVVDRIAMLKAGLTDPGRPVGVFLFAGPTGTGKTELAKTLAEYLFGTPERLIRLDMSEFQQPNSIDKIIGASDDESLSQSLIQRVRKQPFAVILLDEFEKAHANVWDLFLQVFDDGRLTDTMGQVADFRHTIIILTSNLGATAHKNAGLGFAPRGDAFSQEQVLRAVSQSFRPEFVNRLDKVIVFRPLTRDRMRSILRKELARVLERRGLQNREWAVEWESSALEFLLEKGFTADMGARPLKRAIDQFLLAPLAATMVERRFPTGDQFLFVRSDGESIQVEFVDPNSEPATPVPVAGEPAAAVVGTGIEALASAVLQPAGSRPERDKLSATLARLEAQLAGAEWENLRDELAAQMADGEFWNRDDRHRLLSRYALMDRVKAALGTTRALSERHGRGLSGRAGTFSRELAGRFALQLLLVDRGIRDALSDAAVEVVLSVEPAMDSGADAEQTARWCQRVADMYDGWVARRHMQGTQRALPSLTRSLVVTGFGAASVLSRENGLHVLESEDSKRCVARVRVAPLWAAESAAEIPASALVKALATAPATSAIIRRYRIEPSPLVRDAERGWRTGRLDVVMAGDFDLF